MKTIIRNLLGIVRRFKMAMLLNVMGLSVAFAAFIILMIQLQYDWGFDRYQKNAKQIFRVGLYMQSWGNQVVVSRPFANTFLHSSPHIEKAALISGFPGQLPLKAEGRDKEGESLNCFISAITPEYTSIFDFQMLEGRSESMDNPGTVLISKTQAQKFFDGEPAVGKQLSSDRQVFTIGGVYKDFPQNSIVGNSIYRKLDPKENAENWYANNYQLYVLLDNPGVKDDVIANFKNSFSDDQQYDWKVRDVRLTQLTDIYYEEDAQFDSQKDKGNKMLVVVLFTIAILIVFIAGINFTNFSNALVPMRIRSVNTQKVLGESDGMLRSAMLVEAVVICLFSFAISLFIVRGMSHTWLADIISPGISLKENVPLLVLTGVLAVLTGVLAGMYPAWNITSYSPALVLKGSFGLSPSGKKLRSLLVSFQFVISFALIIASLFIYLQNHYMLNSSLGFDKEHIAIVKLSIPLMEHKGTLQSELEHEAFVQDVTFAESLLSAGDNYPQYGRGYRDERIGFKIFPVSPEFLRIMDIPVISGRDFQAEDEKSAGGVYIFNETARLQYDLVAGEYITGFESFEVEPALIVGFIDDIKYASFRTAVEPMAFYVPPVNSLTPKYAYIKMKAGTDIGMAVKSIGKVLTSVDRDFPVEISFYDTILDNLYKRELSIGWLISLFSLIAVFISIVGVLGLVLFESEYKRKEIGIRKVHGATVKQILLMFNKAYMRILAICFLLAMPFAYYGVNKWMAYFVYKIPLYWWVYLVAFVVVSTITFLAVTFQNWKVANENPVNSIKTE
ncbi:ABC transporter permease [Parabacteroides sp.]